MKPAVECSLLLSEHSVEELRDLFFSLPAVYRSCRGLDHFPLYPQELGAGAFFTGVIYAINLVVQFLIMRRLDPLKTKSLSVWAICSQWSVLSVTPLPPHIFSSSRDVHRCLLVVFSHVGSTCKIVKLNPDKATAASLINSMIGTAGLWGPFSVESYSIFSASGRHAWSCHLLYFRLPALQNSGKVQA